MPSSGLPQKSFSVVQIHKSIGGAFFFFLLHALAATPWSSHQDAGWIGGRLWAGLVTDTESRFLLVSAEKNVIVNIAAHAPGNVLVRNYVSPPRLVINGCQHCIGQRPGKSAGARAWVVPPVMPSVKLPAEKHDPCHVVNVPFCFSQLPVLHEDRVALIGSPFMHFAPEEFLVPGSVIGVSFPMGPSSYDRPEKAGEAERSQHVFFCIKRPLRGPSTEEIIRGGGGFTAASLLKVRWHGASSWVDESSRSFCNEAFLFKFCHVGGLCACILRRRATSNPVANDNRRCVRQRNAAPCACGGSCPHAASSDGSVERAIRMSDNGVPRRHANSQQRGLFRRGPPFALRHCDPRPRRFSQRRRPLTCACQ